MAALRPVPLGPRLASTRPHEGLPDGIRWRPIRRLGEGGMGVVWEVEHVELGRRAALKVLHDRHRDREDMAERLRDEARALGRVRHPAVPDVLDLGALPDGRPYFVMQLIAGRDLRAELTRLGALAVPTAVRWMAEVLDALDVVHEAGLVHRDVKLENVLVDEAGRVALVDFGLALRMDASLRRTGRGRVVGTLRSMSPEQHAMVDVDHRADLYAVGLCLFELLAGRGPFDGEESTAASMLYAHCRRTPPRVSDVAPQLIQPQVEEVVARALAKSPDDRFASAADMRAALVAAAAHRGARRPTIGRAFPATQVSPSPGAEALQHALAELAELDDEPPTSATWVLSSSALEAP